MPTHQCNFSEHSPIYRSRIILGTLRKSKGEATLTISDAGHIAKTTPSRAREVLEPLVEIDEHGSFRLNTSTRVKLALEAARLGRFQEAARALTWREFEEFSEECMNGAGLATQRGVIVHQGKKRWQIDLVAVRDRIILAVDCKHWASPNYLSKFQQAVDHHKATLKPLVHSLKASGSLGQQDTWALPVILTLFEPRVQIFNEVVLLSIGQLSDFLEHLSPFDSDLPFTAVIT